MRQRPWEKSDLAEALTHGPKTVREDGSCRDALDRENLRALEKNSGYLLPRPVSPKFNKTRAVGTLVTATAAA